MSIVAPLRGLRTNPIYLRERGQWGRPNPFYDRFRSYSPLIILGAIILGFCSAVTSPLLYSDNSAMLGLYCLICIPNALVAVLTLYGVLMAPALTVPSILMERNAGTWEILQATPYSKAQILLAKLSGSLARIGIWPVIWLFSLLQGIAVFCGSSVTAPGNPLAGSLPALAVMIRPSLEIIFAGTVGLAFSFKLTSGSAALAATYAVVFLTRLLNNTALWIFILSGLGINGDWLTPLGIVAPAMTIAFLVVIVGGIILR